MMNQNQEFRVYTLTQMETSDFDHIDLYHFILHFIFALCYDFTHHIHNLHLLIFYKYVPKY